MKFLKPLFLILILAQTSLSVWCYVKGVWGFMENVSFAIQIGFILLGLTLGLSGIKMLNPPISKGRQIAGWILFILSAGFGIFMIIQDSKLIMNPPKWPFG